MCLSRLASREKFYQLHSPLTETEVNSASMIALYFALAALLVTVVVAGTSPGISVHRNFLTSVDIASLDPGECAADRSSASSSPASKPFRSRGVLPASIGRKLTTVLPNLHGGDDYFGEVQFTTVEGTTPVHTDCVMDDEGGILPGVDSNAVDTVFVFLNTNPNAQFVYSPNHVSNDNEEVRVDVVAGDLVRFKASTFHRTELTDGFVNLLGPLTSVNNHIRAVNMITALTSLLVLISLGFLSEPEYSNPSTFSFETLYEQGEPFNVTTSANKRPAQVACASTGTTSSVESLSEISTLLSAFTMFWWINSATTRPWLSTWT